MRTKQGECPECGADSRDCTGEEFIGDEVLKHFVCDDCECEYDEVYILYYDKSDTTSGPQRTQCDGCSMWFYRNELSDKDDALCEECYEDQR